MRSKQEWKSAEHGRYLMANASVNMLHDITIIIRFNCTLAMRSTKHGVKAKKSRRKHGVLITQA